MAAAWQCGLCVVRGAGAGLGRGGGNASIAALPDSAGSTGSDVGAEGASTSIFFSVKESRRIRNVDLMPIAKCLLEPES